MEAQVSGSSLPIAALSLHALAPSGVFAPCSTRAHKATVPSTVAGVRDGPRSHPITARLPADVAECEARPAASHKPNALRRLVGAVPAALSRLMTAPVNQAPFATSARLSDVRVFPTVVPKRTARGGSARPAGAGARKAAIVWFRNDLRLHDNPSLEQACREGSSVLPVYVFDPRDYGKTPTGFDRTGPARAQFILDAVFDLRSRLRAAGSELVVRVGRPEEVVAELAGRLGAGTVYCQAEVTAEEAQVEGRVRASLERDGCKLRALWGGTLFHLEDLPFKLASMPTSYADFRSRVAGLSVRPLAESEGGIKGLPQGSSVEAGELPSLQQLGLTAPPRATAAATGTGFGAAVLASTTPPLRGGESEALRHLHAFMAELKSSLARGQQQPQRTAKTGPGSGPAPGSAFSCHISPWLALGCLSPRRMYHEMKQHLGGAQVITAPAAAQPVLPAAAAAAAPARAGAPAGSASSPANWLVFELLWRDFFRFVTQKYAANTRLPGGRSALASAGAAAPAPALAAV